jgi:hypothetical protein
MGEWRRLHNVEPEHWYSSPSIVQVIKSGRKGWMGHVVHMRRGAYRILVGKYERERDHLEYVSKDGRIIVK